MDSQVDNVIARYIEAMQFVVQRKGQETEPARPARGPKVADIPKCIIFYDIMDIIEKKWYVKCIWVGEKADKGDQQNMESGLMNEVFTHTHHSRDRQHRIIHV